MKTDLSTRVAWVVYALLLLSFYTGMAWMVSGGDTWWQLDFIHGFTIFYGDDAYRYFLTRAAFTDADLYAYNFVLPVQLIVDGLLHVLWNGSLFAARATHGLVGLASMLLAALISRSLGASHGVTLLTGFLAGAMPLYALVSLSFYGEVWLCFFLMLAACCWVRGALTVSALLFGLLPLVRPEGIFFMIPPAIFLLMRGRFRPVALMVAPGAIYFLYLLWVLDDFSDFGYWRVELRKILARIVLNKSKLDIFQTLSPLFLLPALYGAWQLRRSPFLPVLLGALLWFVMLLISIFLDQAFYEPRYTYVFVPLLSILWALALQNVSQRLWVDWKNIRFLKMLALVVWSGLVLHSGLMQMTLIKRFIDHRGWFAFTSVVKSSAYERIFPVFSSSDLRDRKAAVAKIGELLENNPRIDQLLIFDVYLYYVMDPRGLPQHVRASYPALSYIVFDMLMNGQVFSQHQGDKMYSYFRFSKPVDGAVSESLALYVDRMGGDGYPFLYKVGAHEIYLFSYRHSLVPEKDVSTAPLIYPEMVRRELMRSHR